VGIEPILENAGIKPAELIIPSELDPVSDSKSKMPEDRAQHKSNSESEYELEQQPEWQPQEPYQQLTLLAAPRTSA
jgi:hypothetical protein